MRDASTDRYRMRVDLSLDERPAGYEAANKKVGDGDGSWRGWDARRRADGRRWVTQVLKVLLPRVIKALETPYAASQKKVRTTPGSCGTGSLPSHTHATCISHAPAERMPSSPVHSAVFRLLFSPAPAGTSLHSGSPAAWPLGARRANPTRGELVRGASL
jgi:hypothetical protein